MTRLKRRVAHGGAIGLVLAGALTVALGANSVVAAPLACAATPGAAATAAPQTAATPTEAALPTQGAIATEDNPPGDIPDNQAFVPYTSANGGYAISMPEGWART